MAYKKNSNNKKSNNNNKDYKNKLKEKKDFKQQGKKSDKVDQQPYYPDYSQNLSLISRLRAGKPGSIVKVRHFEVGAVDVGTLDYLKSHITSAINTLATQRGYQSTVDFSTVEDYVDKLIDLEIAAATFLRTQNLVKIEDVLGTPVGEAFYTVSRDYISNPDGFYSSTAFNVGATYKKAAFAESVTNHAYSTEFVSPMSKLLTTPHLHSQIASYFGVVHADMESDDDSVFNVLWNEDTPLTFAELKTLIGNVKAVIVTYPDLELILRSLGFSSFEEIGEEFQRDRIQQSMTIRNDGFFEAMLHNSKVNIEILRTSAELPAEVVYTTNSSYPDTFLNDVSSTSTILDPQASGISTINKIAYVALKMFSTGMVYRNYNVISRQTDGSIFRGFFKTFNAIEKWCFDESVIGSPYGQHTGKIDNIYLNNLFTRFKDIDMMIPDDGTQEAVLTATMENPQLYVIDIEIKETAETYAGNESGNRLSVSDALDATLYLDNRKIFLLYGTVE